MLLRVARRAVFDFFESDEPGIMSTDTIFYAEVQIEQIFEMCVHVHVYSDRANL